MPNINLESNDKTVFSVDVEVAKKSITLRDLMMNYAIEETGDEDGDPIPLLDVDAANLEKLLHWAEEHKDDPPPPLMTRRSTGRTTSATSTRSSSTWTRRLCSSSSTPPTS